MARTNTRKPAGATVPQGGDIEVIRSAQINSYFEAIEAYNNADKAFESAKDACAAAAFTLLAGVVDHADFIKVRDQYKAADIARRNLKPDDAEGLRKATNTANMNWSRLVARAATKGYKQPEVPQTDEAKAAQAKREAAREKKGQAAYEAAIASGASVKVAETMRELAVDGRKNKGAVNPASKPDNTPPDLSDDAIRIARLVDQQDNDGALYDALEWVLADAGRVARLISYVTREEQATRAVHNA